VKEFIDVYRRFNDRLTDVILVVSKVIVASWVLALFVAALTRHITGVGYDWMLELPPMLVPWVVFPLSAVLLRRNHHITVDFLPLMLGATKRRWLRVLVAAIALAASVVFFIAGFQATILFRDMGQLTQMELQFPLWYIYLSFPAGFGVMVIFALEVLLRELFAPSGTDDLEPGAHAVSTSEWVD
jgi:TRAP-type C4-dicarboxylate transport system permease small subunit